MTIAALTHCKTLNTANINPICFSESSLIASDVKDVQYFRRRVVLYVERYFRRKYRRISCIECIGFPLSLM